MKNKHPWHPSPGDLVQIWDYQYERSISVPLANKIDGHGKVGYVVKQRLADKSTNTGPIFQIICFGDDGESARHDVWHGWLREIRKTSDIKTSQTREVIVA